MTRKQISTTGIVTYWNTTATDIAKLRAACIAVDAGLEKYVPAASTPLNALREALAAVFPGHLVRKLKRDGFAVVREDRGDSQNDYDAVAAAWFDGDDDDSISFSRCTPAQEKSIRQAYHGNRGILQPVQVGTMLSRILGEYLGGTMLRPKTGGVYWLPEDRSAKWQAIAEAVEGASVTAGGSAVYVLHHHMDEAAVRAVRDALVSEVTGEAERIKTEVLGGELGEKALQTREREAKALIDKVKRYESILDVGLGGVRKALGEVKDAAAAAALLVAAGQDPEPSLTGAAAD